ncbi:hypothetical protein C4K28_4122 [Pseudomonas chlororaphis subsp. piscium]|nr:hypothetical protein C4K33_4053 [Pseudomonas chlororaphis subsp. piscium]AZC96842.1 hypothetical protein C4K28_4122 [Pseudomonas chlororaphis subsp. piscium]
MTLQLTGSDSRGSLVLSLSGGVTSTFTYSPFGVATPRRGAAASLPGFNGERVDPFSGVTHLGNGYRAYSPALRRFTCPDSESPFGIGGINPYVYCDSDPINLSDPSGHGPITWLLRKVVTLGIRWGMKAAMADSITAAAAVTANVEAGLAITAGAASAATGIASGATEKNNPEVSQKLKWASLGLGVGSAVFGAGTGVAKVRKGLQGLSKRLGRVQEEGLSGRGAIAAGREMAAERNSPLRLRGGGNDDYPTRLPLDNKRYPPSEEVEFIRGKFNAEPGRNIAFMDYDVEGEIGTFASVSGQAKRLGTVSPPVGRRFRTFAVGHARDYDTEVKLLEKFQRVFPDTNARGAIYLHSQLPMCKSCLSVLDQFSKQYEKIAIYVGDGTKSATRFLPS